MNPRVERWLAHVRKQLPGPMYDHPQKLREPWDENRAAKALYEYNERCVKNAQESINAFHKAWAEYWEANKCEL